MTLSSQSTGQTTTEAQRARDPGALAQNPPRANDDAPPPTNASVPSTAPTTGINGELRPTVSTQGTPPLTATPGPLSPNSVSTDADAQPGGFYGAAAPSDDSGAGLNPIAQVLQNYYGSPQPVQPKPNPLDRCATYTYNITLYLTTPELYNNLLTNKKKSVSGMSVILRSGGMSQSPTVDAQGFQDAARNPNFPLDLYIDNLQIKSVLNGKGTMSPHNATEINFRVIEPNGITFIHNLQAATNALALGTGSTDNAYLSQIYLMVIRFYGFDQNGNPVAPDTDVAAQQSDRTAITEKFIPFMFTGVRFKIANKLTEYDCSAVAVGNMIATGQQRGVIPTNVQITSATLAGALTELENALNKFQENLCQEDSTRTPPAAVYTYPDVYSFQLVPPLDIATLKPPGETLNTQTGMNPTVEKDPRSPLPAAQSVKSTTKLSAAFPGMSIVQFLDQIVRQSDYIYKQQKYYFDPVTQKLQKQTGSGKLMVWYRIAVQAVPRRGSSGSSNNNTSSNELLWDPRRRDYAYDVTYQITPYLVTDVLSDYFPKSDRWPVPKEYNYWFTGKNNSILDFTQDFNNLYYFVVNAPQPQVSESQLKNESKKGYQPASNVSSAGMPGKVNEPGANAAQYLYSPADLARARMTIVGDPDWIQQGDLWSGIIDPDDFGTIANQITYDSGPDAGGINYIARETLFDIVFKTPADYNMDTGLITDPSATTPGPTVNGTPRMLEMRTRYKAISVVNNFSQGRFTQEIEGVMVTPDVARDQIQTAQAQTNGSTSATGTSAGTSATSPGANTSVIRVPQSQQNASLPINGFASSYQRLLPGGGRSPGLASQLNDSSFNTNLLRSSAPTSGTEVVGPADSAAAAVRSVGGASGFSVGDPSVTLTLPNRQSRSVTSQTEIDSLLAAGQISSSQAFSASRALASQQQAANNPISSAPKQIGAVEP